MIDGTANICSSYGVIPVMRYRRMEFTLPIPQVFPQGGGGGFVLITQMNKTYIY